MSDCAICKGEGWVCENHPEIPWNGGNQECCGGAGSPCACNSDLSLTGFEGGCIIASVEDIPDGLRRH